MQFEGGYRYPAAKVCTILLLLGLAAVTIVWAKVGLPPLRAGGVLLSVEGTVLWASSFTPKGLTPPSSGRLRELLHWFFAQQSGVTFALNQPMFYAGILLVIAGTVVSSVAC